MPLIVYYYAGSSPTERSFNTTHQFWAANGYAVLVINPRGAYGYGEEFANHHAGDGGPQAGADVLAGTLAGGVSAQEAEDALTVLCTPEPEYCQAMEAAFEAATDIARALDVSELVIGLTVVAVGTSLPELVTSAVAAMKRKPDIAVGNVVGSNIFNIFFVLGTTATITPLPFMSESNLDVGMTVFTGLLPFAFMFSGRKGRVDRWEGAVALLLYAAYIGYRIVRQ